MRAAESMFPGKLLRKLRKLARNGEEAEGRSRPKCVTHFPLCSKATSAAAGRRIRGGLPTGSAGSAGHEPGSQLLGRAPNPKVTGDTHIQPGSPSAYQLSQQGWSSPMCISSRRKGWAWAGRGKRNWTTCLMGKMGSDLAKDPARSSGALNLRENTGLSSGAQASMRAVPTPVSPKLMKRTQSCFQKIPCLTGHTASLAHRRPPSNG